LDLQKLLSATLPLTPFPHDPLSHPEYLGHDASQSGVAGVCYRKRAYEVLSKVL